MIAFGDDGITRVVDAGECYATEGLVSSGGPWLNQQTVSEAYPGLVNRKQRTRRRRPSSGDARSGLAASGAEDQATSAVRCGGRGPATAAV